MKHVLAAVVVFSFSITVAMWANRACNPCCQPIYGRLGVLLG